MNSQIGAYEIKSFYDEFLHSQMLGYRLRGNERIDRAVARILPHTRPKSRILDIGCGIGLVAEKLAARATQGRIWACDISDKNIWYAKQTVRQANISFFVSDVVRDFETLRRNLTERVDLITLVDVIEHLPLETHRALFENLASISAIIVLTYPSPEYQRFLHKNHPDRLQIVDESVEVRVLLDAVSHGGFGLRQFSVEDVWMRRQYVHCVLDRGSTVGPLIKERGTLRRLRRFASRVIDRTFRIPIRRRRYIDQVFGAAPSEKAPSRK